MQGPDGDGATLYDSRGVSRLLTRSREKETDLVDFCQGGGCSVGSQIFGRLLWMGVNMAEVSVREVGSWLRVLWGFFTGGKSEDANRFWVECVHVVCVVQQCGEKMGVGGCESWGEVTEVFAFSAELLLRVGSGRGGGFCFLDRERERRVGEACLL